jgi:N-acetylglucosamine-6-phosphate deacetylase
MRDPRHAAMNGRRPALALAAFVPATAAFAAFALAQDPPPAGMRPSDVRRDAIVNVTVIPEPGERLADGVVLMRDGRIERIGARGSFELPAGTTVHDGHGGVACAAFVEPCLRIDTGAAARAAAQGQAAHWNAKVVPQVRASDVPAPGADVRKELRALGFATACLHPDTGILRGEATVLLLGDDPRSSRALVASAGTVVAFESAGDGDWDRATYPGSLMGAIALVRQTFLDARWHAECERAWAANPGTGQPPVTSDALRALHAAAAGEATAWLDATDDRAALRAAGLARELGLRAVIVGSGREYRRAAELRAAGVPVVVPMEFPQAPDLSVPRGVDAMPLRELAHWAMAPANLAELVRAGVPAAASTVRMKDRPGFRRALQRASDAGTTDDELLAALTVNAARAAGVERTCGTLRPGMLANVAVFTGAPFDPDSELRATWVAGVRHDVAPRSPFPARGTFTLGAAEGPVPEGFRAPATVTVDPDRREVGFVVPAQAPDAKPQQARGQGAAFDAARATFVIDGDALGAKGPLRGTVEAAPGGFTVALASATGAPVVRWSVPAAARTGDVPPRGTDLLGDASGGKSEREKRERSRAALQAAIASIPRTAPLGDFGLEPADRPRVTVIRGATVWTAGAAGIVEGADVVVRDGRIEAVGKGAGAAAAAEPGATVVDAAGKHVTPGIIDCHSHTGIDGGVNEWTQNCTAEVRIGDVVNADDVDWYRQLAGGVTCVNQLHGSANPIGGQNSVVKLRWGRPASEFPVQGAPGGIKFALGENVTRNKGRYPSSRMGVETLMRDRFAAAKEHRDAHARWRSMDAAARAGTMPPRPDLELDALAEVVGGTRLVHCHSYRQDEIGMMLRVAEEAGFRVATLQHVLEGYKVADEIARHGAGASSFSDWWAYKVEVMDAIPWNGQMLWKAGVVTSFNSDSDEMARRMNTEAAKAVRYGGVPREEAIRFVTLNAAKQLRIDARTGSLEPGKDADLALWSADPLSVYARCEGTWVDGVRLFDLAADARMRARDAATRARIVELAVTEASGGPPDPKAGTERKDGPAAAPGDAPKPTEGRSTLLARMLVDRDRQLRDMVRGGTDPEAVRPGECGCDAGDTWAAIFEVTGGEGGRR